MEEHQREEAQHLRFRQQLDEKPPEADGFGREVVPRQQRARRRLVAFIEDEIDHPQHGVQPPGQLGGSRHLIRNAGVADLCFGADDPLRKRRRRREKRLRDLLGRQAAHFTQRQRHLRVRRQRRMAAREDESQPIVLDALVVRPRRSIEDADIGALAHVVERIEPGAAPKAVDCLEPSR